MNMVLRVATYTPLPQYYDYTIPAGEECEIGSRVIVPFGKRTILGMVIDKVATSSVGLQQLKAIHEVIDDKALLSTSLLKLCQWASQYYHYPLGEILFSVLPKLLRQGKSLASLQESTAVYSGEILRDQPEYSLNYDQLAAIAAVQNSSGFKVFLLQGVTGSGKTEVYFQTIFETLKAGKQVLILVPEISLTPQTVERFQQRFAVPVAILHSRLSDRKRMSAWLQVQSGAAPILIGTRSAIFTPMLNPGMIILDEEHDASFKQQTRFRYSARDLAIMRGQFENIPVILGSATPSLESLYNAKRERYHLLKLSERVGEAVLPTISLVDLRKKKLEGGLSETLLRAIRKHLQRKEQVFLFLNRRGYAPILLCHHCGWMVRCKRCDAHMTLHQRPQRLFCHHCGDSRALLPVCSECRQSTLSAVGCGTEQLEQVLKLHFPDQRILRIDSDSVRSKKDLEKYLRQIHQQEGDILIGTQMLAKGHHFPHLTFVGIVDTDNGLFSVDFRAMERMGQIILQVAGRAGRVQEQGTVMIQTHHPNHPLLKLLIDKDYEDFADELLIDRKNAALPPFTHLALLRAEDPDQKKPSHGLNLLKNKIKKAYPQLAVEILGPIPAAMELKAGRYRSQLLFRSDHRMLLHQLLSHLTQELAVIKEFRKLRWSLDVDPQDVI